ncbi:MAG: exodeoxyribonuclease VII small subunit [Phycisphaera sp. TMED9]|nr:MAG: exodeoxyribonuclease VII small subunit [Phycisphaera sp. TMED9]
MATSKKSKKDSEPDAPLRFEAAAEELESIIDQLEQGDIPLEESLAAYGRGRSLLARCRSILDAAAAEIAEVDLDALDDDTESNA